MADSAAVRDRFQAWVEELETFVLEVIFEQRRGKRAAIVRSLLSGLSRVFLVAVKGRQFLYNARLLRDTTLGVQVIAIGNLTVGRFTGHIRGESLSGEAACAAFLEHYCRPFGLKKFRAEQRKQLHLSVSWSRVDGLSGSAPMLATTMNVSRRGMFIIDPTGAVDVGTRVHVHLSPASHGGPLLGVVCWCLPWGQSTHHPPGFGIELIELSAAQREAFDQVAGWSQSALPEDEGAPGSRAC